mgnify:CR=1 FL=1
MVPPPRAPVFWLPGENTSVVVLEPAPAPLAASPERPRLAHAAARTGEDGSHRLYDLGNSQTIQLLQLGSQGTPSALAAVVPLDITGFDRLQSVSRLLAALHGRAVPPDTRLTRQQRARARRMLQASDGARDGATQQEIAQVLFRIGRIGRDEWQTSATRHAVMSLLRDGRSMIAGGYRRLLRYRHRR